MNTARVLEEIGLTEGESNVYLALLRLGNSTVGDIIKEAGVSNSKVYNILDRLNKKGLVGIAKIDNTKHFEAKDPHRLEEFIRLKQQRVEKQKQQVQKILPDLHNLYSQQNASQEAEILQGKQGIKTFCELILDELEDEDTFYIMGAPKEANELLGPYFQDWHERRVDKQVHCKLLYNRDAADWKDRREETPMTETRFLPEEVKTPALIDIGKPYVATMLFGTAPLCIVIKNNKIAESYLSYFKFLWNAAD